MREKGVKIKIALVLTGVFFLLPEMGKPVWSDPPRTSDRKPAQAALPGLESFPLKDGLRWKYDSNLGEVVSWVELTGKKCTLISRAPHLRIKQHLLLSKEGVLMTGGESKIYFITTRRVYQPPLLRFPIPLAAGRSWSWQGKEIVNGKPMDCKMEGVMAGRETIRVPAGEFRCRKVKVTTVSDDGTSSSTQWLAPGVGVVKAEIKIDVGGLTGFLLRLLGLDEFRLELKEISSCEAPAL